MSRTEEVSARVSGSRIIYSSSMPIVSCGRAITFASANRSLSATILPFWNVGRDYIQQNGKVLPANLRAVFPAIGFGFEQAALLALFFEWEIIGFNLRAGIARYKQAVDTQSRRRFF